MMKQYEFVLKFEVPKLEDPSALVEQLYAAGCDDALIGTGQAGRLALDFTREAASAIEAITSAIDDVKRVIPTAILIEATPDLVGLTDIAEIMGCSRQNIRKIAVASEGFPSPMHEGVASLWHLNKVLPWFKARGRYKVEASLLEVSEVTMQINVMKQSKDLDPKALGRIQAVI